MLVQTGMTTSFTPNKPVILMNGSTPVDIDFVSSRLGTSATNAAHQAAHNVRYRTHVVPSQHAMIVRPLCGRSGYRDSPGRFDPPIVLRPDYGTPFAQGEIRFANQACATAPLPPQTTEPPKQQGEQS
ncbi:MAG TPA: hypothetical protein VND64_00610 [Pirellulales bacterium]|nr:hypothetical protein [Pirellulales bacterium]